MIKPLGNDDEQDAKLGDDKNVQPAALVLSKLPQLGRAHSFDKFQRTIL